VVKTYHPTQVVKEVPAKPMMTRKEYEDKGKAFIETRRKQIT
jgi:hypothetical protein